MVVRVAFVGCWRCGDGGLRGSGGGLGGSSYGSCVSGEMPLLIPVEAIYWGSYHC